jgi:dipeptidyl aminopeptidase/acylaminoacyl peptidase
MADMRTSRITFLTTFAWLFLASGLSAQKKPLDHDAYDIWHRISGQALSDDGKWLVYQVVSEKEDPVVHVTSVASGTDITLDRAEAAQFTDDSRFLVFRINPAKKATEQAKKDKVKADQMPQDSLGILDLGTGQVTFRTEKVRSFKLPEKNGGWVAYEIPKPGDTTQAAAGGGRGGRGGRGGGRGGAAGGANRRKTDGSTVVLRSLANGQERRIEMVSSFEFADDGSRLVYTTSTKDGSNDGAFAMNTANGQVTTLLAGKGEYRGLALDDAGTRAAFVSTKDDPDAKQPEYKLYYWDGKAAAAKTAAASQTSGMPSDWIVSENRTPSFSGNGQRLFFGASPRPAPEPDSADMPAADERVVVDVWSWTDPLLQPMQLRQLDQERRRTYDAVYNTGDGSVLQLANEDMPDLVLASDGDIDVALGRSNLAYRQEISWGESGNDLYVVNLKTGQRTKVLDHVQGQNQISPTGKYIAYWDGENLNWNVMDVATKQVVNVSKSIPYPVHDVLHDSPSLPSPEGSAGWTQNDAQFLVYDWNDIWAVDPTGKTEPRNLTDGVGRKENLRFRYSRIDPDEDFIKPNQDLLLSTFNYQNKQEGFYRDRMANNVQPKQLVMMDKSFGGGFGGSSVRKAEDANVLLFTRGSFEEFPDVYVSGMDFADMKRMSDANPQQSKYTWGTSELVSWRSAMDGQMLQGILYKPENFDPSKKYPMMVYFYERLSDNLNNYVVPAAGSSSINISFYVSRGYLVFTPDIPYQVGYPGESALKSIVPGVLSLIDEGFVDEKHVGMQGHSWGGYQVGYLVTKTNLFAAAEAGAPVSDMISAYGGIRWSTGMSRMFQYEKTQSRIGGTLWEAPVHYIENSPIFWVDKVETPLLMMHNDQDGSVPWYQGIEYFVALRRLNKPAWMLNYNGEDHGLGKEQNRKDWAIRMQQFFDHYLKGAPMPVWMAEGVPAILKGKTLGEELMKPKATTSQQGISSRN